MAASLHNGKGVTQAVDNVNDRAICSKKCWVIDALDQIEVDRTLIELDGTPNKSRIGANAILGVSLAVAKAAAESSSLPLYRYIGGPNAHVLPVPMMNIINGGAHADNPIDMQEFMILPVGAESIAHAVQIGSEIFHTLKKNLAADGHNTNVGDEGGFAPNLSSAEVALDYIVKSIEKAGYSAGKDVYLGLDCAATEYFKGGKYEMAGEGKSLSSEENARFLAGLVDKFPIITIEDGMGEDDWEGWKILTDLLGKQVQLVGDDLFVTNTQRLRFRHQDGRCQLDPRQGQPDRLALRDAGRRRYRASRRLYLGHVAPLGRNRGFHHCRPRRRAATAGRSRPARSPAPTGMAKYNQLIRIEEQLGGAAKYAGRSIIRG
jgi:enolase